MHQFCCIDTLTGIYLVSDNGVTPTGFTLLEERDFEELGLSIIGKKLVQKALREGKM